MHAAAAAAAAVHMNISETATNVLQNNESEKKNLIILFSFFCALQRLRHFCSSENGWQMCDTIEAKQFWMWFSTRLLAHSFSLLSIHVVSSLRQLQYSTVVHRRYCDTAQAHIYEFAGVNHRFYQLRCTDWSDEQSVAYAMADKWYLKLNVADKSIENWNNFRDGPELCPRNLLYIQCIQFHAEECWKHFDVANERYERLQIKCWARLCLFQQYLVGILYMWKYFH